MNIQTFSPTYWYIWLLVILLFVLLLIINGGGVLCFYQRRNQLVKQVDRSDEKSSISAINSTYQEVSNRSSLIERSSFTVTTHPRFSWLIQSEEMITSTPKSAIDLLEHLSSASKPNSQFHKEALAEHNLIRARYKKCPLKLTETLNIYAQCWADQCTRTNIIVPSRLDWRLNCNGQPLGETIISTQTTNRFDGIQFTRMIIANDEQSKEVQCLLNEVSTEVGFGFAQSENKDKTQEQWIAVAHYYPIHQLTPVQS